jgi:hypothetical protein
MFNDITQKIYNSIGGKEFFDSINLVELNSLGNSLYFRFDTGNKVNHCSITLKNATGYTMIFHKLTPLGRDKYVTTYLDIPAHRLNVVFYVAV